MLMREEASGHHVVRRVLPGRAVVTLRFIEGLVTVSIGLAIYLWYVGHNLPLDSGRYLIAIAAGILTYQVLSEWLGANEVTLQIGDASHVARAFGAWTLTFAILLALAFVMKISESFSRVWAVSWYAGTSVSLVLLRVTIGQWLVRRAEQGQFAVRTVIVGIGKQAQELAEYLCDRQGFEIDLLGFVDDRNLDSSDDHRGINVLGNLDLLIQMIRAERVDQVIVALPPSSNDRLRLVMDRLSLTPVRACVMPFSNLSDLRDRKLSEVSGIPMVEVLSTPMSEGAHALKTAEDWIIGALALLFVGPLMLCIALAIKLDSRGSVFFRQAREGYNGNLIDVWKFRTMYENAADYECQQQTTANDPRVTRVGRFLRRSSLDELPQLFNVLNGTMSLVGPRPHAPETKAAGQKFVDVVDRYAARHRVKPGITGLAQVHGWRGETDSLEKIHRRVEYDLYYIEHWSLWLDFWILAKTLWAVLRGDNAY
jgi:Undecaprenyl-phosphate glucose phosphotransferase